MMNFRITMTLRSDAIFGSGDSVPGGEDIAVKTDAQGYPYLSGSTLKGLLREQAANWLDWTGAADAAETLAALFGAENRKTDCGDTRAVFVSPLVAADRMKPGRDYLSQRTFTRMDAEAGTAAKGSLRIAACVRRGSVFTGTLSCAEEDAELMLSALNSIRALGTGRSRGFGEVELTAEPVGEAAAIEADGAGDTLCYSMVLAQPVRITERSDSHDTLLASRNTIPGSTIRGAVLSALAGAEPELFAAHKAYLLRALRFTDAIPGNPGDLPAIPTPNGFYTDKLGKEFYSLPVRGKVIPGTKRAKLGAFCTLERRDEAIALHPWSPFLGIETRIRLGDTAMFQSEQLLPGQQIRGLVQVPADCPEELRASVARVLGRPIRLGANRRAGFGLCLPGDLTWRDAAPETEAYGFRTQDEVGTEVYLLLLSRTMPTNEYGEPCGIDEALLERLVGTAPTAGGILCATSLAQAQGYNSTLGVRLPAGTAYEQGSLFRITFPAPPELEALRRLEREGIGARREEGFGRVLFLRDWTGPFARSESLPTERKQLGQAQQLRRDRAAWLNRTTLPGGMSKSQIGSLQSALATFRTGSVTEAEADVASWFDTMIRDNPKYREQFSPMRDFILGLLQADGLPLSDPSSAAERLALIDDLIKRSRKEGA